jgi:hypothetical protein
MRLWESISTNRSIVSRAMWIFESFSIGEETDAACLGKNMRSAREDQTSRNAASVALRVKGKYEEPPCSFRAPDGLVKVG